MATNVRKLLAWDFPAEFKCFWWLSIVLPSQYSQYTTLKISQIVFFNKISPSFTTRSHNSNRIQHFFIFGNGSKPCSPGEHQNSW
jgi:hypothetical protein